MKYLLAILILFSLTANAGERIVTSVKLPNNEPIWPLVEFDMTSDMINVAASFESQKEVLRIVQGDWEKITYEVRYRVDSIIARYPHSYLVFIAEDTIPTKESGIVIKKSPWPFIEGSKGFVLKEIESASDGKYFSILTY